MNNRERFNHIFNYQKADRMPVYYFGTWPETKVKWAEDNESYKGPVRGHAGPQLKGMDEDWETGMWGCQGLFKIAPISDLYKILEETNDYIIRRNSDGCVEKELKNSTSINHTISYGLEPNRASWEAFKERLNPDDPKRYPSDLDEKVKELKEKDIVRFFHGGSLYGWLRNWMGVENISYFMFDDPLLLEEMVSYITDFMMKVSYKALSKVEMDVAYIWEDCCGSTGPLFSPLVYKEIFDKHYRRLFDFYKSMGVKNIMLDSDGYCDPLIPCWLSSGVDIVFPLEVGTWENTPDKVRHKFGRQVKIFGGVNKHVIPLGKDAIKEHLLSLKPCVDEGGYIPIPDHRIPPDCTLESMYDYIDVFNDVFNKSL